MNRSHEEVIDYLGQLAQKTARELYIVIHNKNIPYYIVGSGSLAWTPVEENSKNFCLDPEAKEFFPNEFGDVLVPTREIVHQIEITWDIEVDSKLLSTKFEESFEDCEKKLRKILPEGEIEIFERQGVTILPMNFDNFENEVLTYVELGWKISDKVRV